MSPKKVFERFARFKDGCECFESIEQTGRILRSKNDKNIELVRVSVHENRKTNIQELADDLNPSSG